MKRYQLQIGILLFFYTVTVKGQITISQSDMPQPGDTVRLSTCNSNVGLPDPSLTGASYMWDFTKLIAFTQKVDTFLSVASTPFAYQLFFNDVFLYPKYVATVAQAAPNFPQLGPVSITNVINYYKATSSDYEQVGFGANVNGIPTSVKDDTIDYIYRFPMSYGNADSCHSSFKVSIANLGYYGQHQYRVNHVDGWGTLKTPFGTFNTLRVKTMLYTTDSVYVDTPIHFGFALPLQQIQYKWFGTGSKEPLLQVNEQVNGNNATFTSAVYRDSARKALLGIAQAASSPAIVRLFPNPNNGKFTIQWSEVSGQKPLVEIYNMVGERVYRKQLTMNNGQLTIDLYDKASGVYLYRILSETGNLVSEGKFIIK